MLSEKEILDSILYRDGSCRDLSINKLTVQDVKRTFGNLAQIYDQQSATDQNGNDIDVKNEIALLNSQLIFSYWKNNQETLTNIQLFISQNDSFYWPELTFFPDDFGNNFSIDYFKKLVNKIFQGIEIHEYFLRYENVSWRYGDLSKYSGVICSNKDYDLF